MSGRKTRRGEPLWPVMTLADVVTRDGPLCPHCGRVATTRQHRINRQAGGSNDRERPSNIIAFCADGNTALEADPGAAAYGREAGWKLWTHQVPADEPFWDVVAGVWVTIDDEGGRTPPRH